MTRLLASIGILAAISAPAAAQTTPSPTFTNITVGGSIIGGALSGTNTSAGNLTVAGPITPTTSQTEAAKAGERVSIGDFGGTCAVESNAYTRATTALTNSGGGVLYFPTCGSVGWNKTNLNTPPGTVLEVDGPGIHQTMIGAPDVGLANKAFYGVMAGNHTGNNYMIDVIGTMPGSNNPNSGTGSGTDTTMEIRTIKQNYATTQIPGQVGGLVLLTRSGGPATGLKSGGFALNSDVLCTNMSGFCTQYEGVTSLASSVGVINYQQDIQFGVEDDIDNSFLGMNMTANVGTHQTAYRVVGNGTARWGDVLENNYGGVQNYTVSDLGAVTTRTDTSGTTTIVTTNESGIETKRNNAGTLLDQIDQSGNFAFGGSLYDATPPVWTSGAAYIAGQRVINAGNVYRVMNGGGTASVAPVQTSGAVTGTDGIEWDWISAGTTMTLLDTSNGDIRSAGNLFVRSIATAPVDVPILAGTGAASNAETSTQGGVFLRTDGGNGRTLYVKENGGSSPTELGWNAVITASIADSLIAAGTTQATALPLTSRNNIVVSVPTTGAGVILSGAVGPAEQMVINLGGASLTVYPPVGAAFDGGTVNAPIKLLPASHARFLVRNTTDIRTIYTPPTITAASPAVTSAGTTQATATVLPAQFNAVTTVGAGTGVELPAVTGTLISIFDRSTNPLLVYPPSGAAIDGNAVNAAVQVVANAAYRVVCVSSTQCYSD